jgi:hypothetical protein
MKNSKFGTLDAKDYIKGFLLSVITSVLTLIYDSIQQGSFSFDLKNIGLVGSMSGIGYLIKNLSSNSNGEPLTLEKQ